MAVFLTPDVGGGLAALAAALAAATRLAASLGFAGLRPVIAVLSVVVGVGLLLAVLLVLVLPVVEVLVVVTVGLVLVAVLEAVMLLLFGLFVAVLGRDAVLDARVTLVTLDTLVAGCVLPVPVLDAAEAVGGTLAVLVGNFLADAVAVDSVADAAEDKGRPEAGLEEVEAVLVEGSDDSEPGLTRDEAGVTLELFLDIGLVLVCLSAPSPGLEPVLGPAFFEGTDLEAPATGALGLAPAVLPPALPAPPAVLAAPPVPPAGLGVGREAAPVLDSVPEVLPTPVVLDMSADLFTPVDDFDVPVTGPFVVPTIGFDGFMDVLIAVALVLFGPVTALLPPSAPVTLGGDSS